MRATLDAPASVAVTFDRLFGFLRRLTPPEGLSLTAASALYRLDRAGSCRLTELAGLEGVTQPGMTQLVSRLERDGLAERTADPGDGRAVLVRITPAGREVLRRRRTVRAERLDELLSQLTAAERAKIRAALPALDRLADLVPPAGLS